MTGRPGPRLGDVYGVAEILRARIARGDWAPGRAIASETALVQQYSLARSTVRRALAVLTESGELFTVPQRGTYIAAPRSSSSLDA